MGKVSVIKKSRNMIKTYYHSTSQHNFYSILSRMYTMSGGGR